MKMNRLIIAIASFLLLVSSPQIRVEDHDHKEEEKSDAHKEQDDHDSKKPDEHDHKDGKHDDDEKEEESVGGVGKNNAVTAADEHEGIQLSAKSQKAIGLKSESYQNGSLPVTALVRHQNQISVYRLRNSWYKRVPVRIEKIENGQAVIQADELSPGDFVVVQNVALSRVAELDAFSGEVGHSH